MATNNSANYSPTIHTVQIGGSNGTLVSVANGNTGQVLGANTGADPSWVSAGTGTVTSVSGTTNQVSVATGTTTPVISLVGPYTPSTYTAHGVLIGATTSSIVATATGSAGQILKSGGAAADPLWTSSTYPSTNSTGDVIYGSGSNAYSNLAISTNIGSQLSSDGTNVLWGNPASIVYVYDEWLDQNGIYNSGTTVANAGTAGQNTSTASNVGLLTLGTGVNTNGASALRFAINGTLFQFGGGITTLDMYCQLSALSDGTNTYTTSIGFGTNSTTTSDPSNGAFFQYTNGTNSGQWIIRTVKAGSATSANTTTAADTNYHRYTITCNAAGTSLAFYIDGVQVTGSPLSTNIPTTAAFSLVCNIIKSAGTTARSINLDYTKYVQVLTTTR